MTRAERINKLIALSLASNGNGCDDGGYAYVLRSGFVGYRNFSDKELSQALIDAGIDPETGEPS